MRYTYPVVPFAFSPVSVETGRIMPFAVVSTLFCAESEHDFRQCGDCGSIRLKHRIGHHTASRAWNFRDALGRICLEL